jgi:hypothetical protein
MFNFREQKYIVICFWKNDYVNVKVSAAYLKHFSFIIKFEPTEEFKFWNMNNFYCYYNIVIILSNVD